VVLGKSWVIVGAGAWCLLCLYLCLCLVCLWEAGASVGTSITSTGAAVGEGIGNGVGAGFAGVVLALQVLVPGLEVFLLVLGLSLVLGGCRSWGNALIFGFRFINHERIIWYYMWLHASFAFHFLFTIKPTCCETKIKRKRVLWTCVLRAPHQQQFINRSLFIHSTHLTIALFNKILYK